MITVVVIVIVPLVLVTVTVLGFAINPDFVVVLVSVMQTEVVPVG